VNQRIVISGLGGQGVLTLTRLLAEAALRGGGEVLASETHGMAQRGGSVISTVKVGPYLSPLVEPGTADLLLLLAPQNLPAHGPFLREGGILVADAAAPGEGRRVDAAGLARRMGNPVAANLILLGHAAAAGALFCGVAALEEALPGVVSPRRLEACREALRTGATAPPLP
jgi:indolepyruvate ferredoxin oxidoreductase beta subunit